MTDIAYRARGMGPLRNVDWVIPQGVSVVVGPNRVGKSTLLQVPRLVQTATASGLGAAIKLVFDGVSSLRNWSLPASAPMSLGFRAGRLEWDAEVHVRGGEVIERPDEQLRRDGELVLWRSSDSADIEGQAVRVPSPARLIPAVLAGWLVSEHVTNDDVLAQFRDVLPLGLPPVPIGMSLDDFLRLSAALLVRSFRTYDYEIKHLLRFGSEHSSSLHLLSSGENVFPLLRNWRDRPDHEHRHEFVLETMREIFPHLGRVGFEQAGQTVTMVVNDRRWPSGKTVPIARESTGFITALLQLCAVASCPAKGLVTLDEIETSLHPRAIRVLIEAMRRWADEHQLRIVLATQSETVLDQFRDDPSRVFVLEPKQERSPQALTELFTPEYLSQFSLGDLFAHLEFGADDPTDS